MFPSSNNGNVDPINYQCPFFTDITSSNSRHQHLQFDQSFFNFPSSPFTPSYDDFFPSQNGEFLAHQEIHQNLRTLEMAESEKTKEKKVLNKCLKKDRHSKINTAQGPRDRRMRLSLKVAREFFDLQDKLCFDKASKTVEWLLIQARSAIKASFINRKESSPSECEVISGFIEEDEAIRESAPKAAKARGVHGKGQRAKPSRKTAFRPQVKELRAKARAKARERTMEKQRSRKIELQEAINKINQFRDMIDTVAEAETPLAASDSISGESLAAIGKWSPFPFLSHLYNPGFPQQEEITDFQRMWG